MIAGVLWQFYSWFSIILLAAPQTNPQQPKPIIPPLAAINDPLTIEATPIIEKGIPARINSELNK